MEVGWYLRLSRASRIEVLIRPDSLPVLEEQQLINSRWRLESAREGEFTRAVFTMEPK